jgi:hypothetical protein
MKRTRPSSRRFAFAAVLAASSVITASFFAPHVRSASGSGGRPPALAQPALVAPGAAKADYPVLIDLERTSWTVRVHGSPSGPLYSVYDAGGAELARMLTVAEISAQFPWLGLPDAWADVPEPAMDSRFR